MAVFTLEDVQSVWTDKSSRTNKSSNVRLMCKGVEQIFRRTNRLKFVSLERRFFPDDLSDETNKSTTVRHKFTSDGQMPDDLSVQTIWSSSSVKTAYIFFPSAKFFYIFNKLKRIICPIFLCNKKCRSPCLFKRTGAFISLSSLLWGKSLTFCTSTSSHARANYANIVYSRDA